jgi:hypothetical protein
MIQWTAVVLAPGLVLLSSFVTFATYNEYPLLTPEILVCGSIILVFGFLLSLLGRLSKFFAAAILSITMLFFADIQLNPPFLVLMLLAPLLFSLCFVLGDNLALIFSVVFATITASTLLLSGTQVLPPVAHPDKSPSSSSLPVFLHIILDEHIGIEGLPEELEGASVWREDLKDFYTGNGFRLFGQAYSNFLDTHLSISHLMNDAVTVEPGLVVPSKFDRFAYRLTRNRHLTQARKAGYRLTVYQPDYVDFCTSTSGDVAVDQCNTYSSSAIGSIRNTELPVAAKVRIIVSMYLSRSQIYAKLRSRYNWLVVYKLGMPSLGWTWDRERIGPIPVMAVLDQIEGDLARARPGDFFLAHLLLPHYPYVYDAGCNLLTDPGVWLNKDASKWGPLNTAASRIERYRNYLVQLACTKQRLDRLLSSLKGSGEFERSIILIHGDHGSRIARSYMSSYAQDRLTPDDYRDSFSTLFAFKSPDVEPGYNRDPWPIGRLMGHLRQAEFRISPTFNATEPPAAVYLGAGDGHFIGTTMPGFDRSQDSAGAKPEYLVPETAVRQESPDHKIR